MDQEAEYKIEQKENERRAESSKLEETKDQRRLLEEELLTKEKELEEHQMRFMQQVKRRIAEKWESIERSLVEGESQKKQSECGRIGDLERVLERELDKLVGLVGEREEENQRWKDQMKEEEGELYREVMDQNLRKIEMQKQANKEKEELLAQEVEDLKKEAIKKTFEVQKVEEELSKNFNQRRQKRRVGGDNHEHPSLRGRGSGKGENQNGEFGGRRDASLWKGRNRHEEHFMQIKKGNAHPRP